MNELKDKLSLRNTIFTDDVSKEVYESTYKFGDENINQTHYRVAKDLASIEVDKEYWTEKFMDLLEDFKFTPGGRITSNAGTELKGTTYINCFVDGFMGTDQDSMEGILSALHRQAMILKSEGGYGFCADVMRPRGAFIGGIGNESPGAVRMLDMWDTQSAVITAGSERKKTTNKKSKDKIRKGAQMVTMSCWHPSICEFITAKQTPGRLTKFNMSVLITDDFMNAVENKLSWDLIFPDYDTDEKIKEIYNSEWDGNINKWIKNGYPTKIYQKFEDANELWDIIMQSTYNRNEPGVLFVDTMNRLNNLWYDEFISATNPCGEQILPIGGVCLLGSINLTQFIDFKNKDWDYKKLEKFIPTIIRFMDNVNDKTFVPLKSQEDNLKNKRRIGLGYLGYASALMMLNLRYGSTEALELTDKLCSFVTNKAYQSSSLLAKEKGAFKMFDERYLESEFLKVLDPETIQLIKKYGIRNSHLISVQPTGNSSVFANNVSGGLEPIFMKEYIRTMIIPYLPDGLVSPQSIDWTNKKYDITDDFKWTWVNEGDESLLKIIHNEITYKIDKNRGLLKEVKVIDYGVRYLIEKGNYDPSADYNATTEELTIDEHINTLKVFAKYIDSAASKTINLPNSYPFEDFKRLYLDIYKTKVIKGATTYRSGTMATVLSSINKEEDIDKITKSNAPKRPNSLPCDIYQVTTKGEKWVVIIGLLGKDPYEIFAFKSKELFLPSKIKDGFLIKRKSGVYDLETESLILKDIKIHFDSDEQEALTRMISTCLRHGANIEFIVDQLQKSEGTIVSFSHAIARTLKRYNMNIEVKESCPECGGVDTLIRTEACIKCINCSFSKC